MYKIVSNYFILELEKYGKILSPQIIFQSVLITTIAFFLIKNEISSFGDPAQNALNSSLPSSWRTKLHEVLISKLQLMFKVNRFKITHQFIGFLI